MKKMRIPLLISLGVAIIGIIFGSFFDLQISQAIASASNGFALTVSAIGPMIGFGAVSLMAGGLLAYGIHGKYHIALRIVFFVLAAAAFGVAVKFSSSEWFGVNGFYGAAPEWVGYFVVLLPEAAAVVGGYFLFRNCSNKNMWIVFLIVIAILGLALVAIIPPLKSFIRRPRYRALAAYPEIPFRNWWESSKGEYKGWMEAFHIESSDHFKSYPSGHTAEASILILGATLFPLADKKFEKYQLPAFFVGVCVTLLVALARILAAAHFLSDVSTGATIVILLTFIANEVVIHIKALHPEEEVKPVEESK